MASASHDLWLVVEDDDNDFLLFRRACFAALDPQPEIHRERDGKGAQAFLRSNPVQPSLIVSDLKMPRMSGLELLEWIRQQPHLTHLRFVVLTSSNQDQDVKAAQKLGADDYKVKPLDVRGLTHTIKDLSTAA
jgi:CheY-like chemotaxis protein